MGWTAIWESTCELALDREFQLWMAGSAASAALGWLCRSLVRRAWGRVRAFWSRPRKEKPPRYGANHQFANMLGREERTGRAEWWCPQCAEKMWYALSRSGYECACGYFASDKEIAKSVFVPESRYKRLILPAGTQPGLVKAIQESEPGSVVPLDRSPGLGDYTAFLKATRTKDHAYRCPQCGDHPWKDSKGNRTCDCGWQRTCEGRTSTVPEFTAFAKTYAAGIQGMDHQYTDVPEGRISGIQTAPSSTHWTQAGVGHGSEPVTPQERVEYARIICREFEIQPHPTKGCLYLGNELAKLRPEHLRSFREFLSRYR